MASKLELLQQRVRDLILVDAAHFYDATVHPAPAGKVPVVMDLPGDIDAEIGKALAAAGIAVIVWQPSFGPLVEGEVSKVRRYVPRVWVRENVVVNRGVAGAIGAEQAIEWMDDLIDGKWNGITPNQSGRQGLIHLAGDGASALKLGAGQPNTWELEFFTNIDRRA